MDVVAENAQDVRGIGKGRLKAECESENKHWERFHDECVKD